MFILYILSKKEFNQRETMPGLFRKLLLFFLLFYFIGQLKANDIILLPLSTQGKSIEITLSETTICPYDSVAMTVNLIGFNSGYIYFIHDGSFTQGSITTGSRTFYLKDEGEFEITQYGIENTEVRDTSIIINIEFYDLPALNFSGGGQFCIGDEISPLNINLAGSGPWTLSYITNNDPITTQTFDQESQILATDNNYQITVLYIEDQNCYDSLSAENYGELIINELPEASINGDSLLCPNTKAFYSTAWDRSYNYTWAVQDSENTYNETDIDTSAISINWTEAGSYTVYLKVLDNSSNCINSVSKDIVVNKLPKVKINYDTSICFGSDGYATLSPVSDPENSIYWTDFDIESNTIDITEEGSYSYIETTPFGCYAEGSINVTEHCLLFFVPEAFTPNNDKTNDILKIFGKFEGFIMYIYSGNGQLVHTMTPDLPYWDGTINNNQAPIGVYYWKAEFYDAYGTLYLKEGNITLLR